MHKKNNTHYRVRRTHRHLCGMSDEFSINVGPRIVGHMLQNRLTEINFAIEFARWAHSFQISLAVHCRCLFLFWLVIVIHCQSVAPARPMLDLRLCYSISPCHRLMICPGNSNVIQIYPHSAHIK